MHIVNEFVEFGNRPVTFRKSGQDKMLRPLEPMGTGFEPMGTGFVSPFCVAMFYQSARTDNTVGDTCDPGNLS